MSELEVSISCQSRSQAEYLAGEVVRLQAEIDQLDAERNRNAADAVEKVRLEYEPKLKEKGELALANFNAVKSWLEENRKEVLPGEVQSFETALARVGFQWTPPRLEPQTGLNWRQVLKRILGLKKSVKLEDGTKVSFVTRFVRIKREPNVDQLKKDILADLVDDESRKEIGVVVKRDENFYIEAR